MAIIGSRNISDVDLSKYIDQNVTEIVSGGARGVDSIAKKYAIDNNIKYTELLPEYSKYARGAPIVRNRGIVDYADYVLAFWDGKSKGTEFVINYCKKTSKECYVVIVRE